jgi:signal transduction histidine kinase
MKNLLKDTKIRTRIFFLLALTLTLMSMVTGVSLWQVSNIGQEITNLTKIHVPLTDSLNRITFNATEQKIHFEYAVKHGMVIAQNATTKDDFETERNHFLEHGQVITQEIVKSRELLGQLLGAYKTSFIQEKAVKVDYELRNISKEHSDYQFAAKRVLNLIAQGRGEQAQTTIKKIEEIYRQDEQSNPLENLLFAIADVIQDLSVHAQGKKQTAVIGMLLFSALILLFGLGTGIFISGGISKPLQFAVDIANQIATGDRDITIETTTKDETGQLLETMKQMCGSINQSEQNLKASNQQLESEIAERKQVEKELSKHRDHLEELVDERTTSLKKSNEKLTHENTKRKQAENRLISLNQELDLTIKRLSRSNKELQDFVYVASHDLREPLRTISSYGQLLEDSLKGQLDEDDSENLQFMIDGADRMTQMVEAMLMYSRISTKGIQFDNVDLNALVEELKGLELAAKLEETGGTIFVPDSLPLIRGDFVQIRQLLQNLIGNALKYHKPKTPPEVWIRVDEVLNYMVRIEIEDNGIGIKEKYYKDIFTMFKRLHSGDSYQGTGIGLSVCRKIMERHGGEIGVCSEFGKGTKFWFTLPVANVAEVGANEQKNEEVIKTG